MVKRIHLLKRKQGLTQEEFLRHWKEIHAHIAARLIPGLRKYVQNHPVGLAAEGEIDGIAELWYDDLKSLQYSTTWHETDAAKELRDDEDRFFDRAMVISFIAEEHVII